MVHILESKYTKFYLVQEIKRRKKIFYLELLVLAKEIGLRAPHPSFWVLDHGCGGVWSWCCCFHSVLYMQLVEQEEKKDDDE